MYVCRWATAARGSGKPDRQAEPQDPVDAQCRGRGGRQAPPVVSVGPYLSRSLRRKGVALSMLRCGVPGRPRASAAAFARRGVQGRPGGAVRRLWRPRRCPLRGRPRANSHPCACGNAAHDRRGSHSGRSQCCWSRATRSRRSNPGSSLTSGGQGSRARAGVHLCVHSACLRSGLRATQGAAVATQTDRRTGTAGLGALDSCSSVARQRVPECAAVACGADKGAQGTATPPREGATRTPRRRVKRWGAGAKPRWARFLLQMLFETLGPVRVLHRGCGAGVRCC
mmetsp:Transcript_1644/g.4157  ORF Transcript_1644/g.4157 Transcript_1644/m.4157 type:complete len:283 (-) Transcript_1644:235-1083(-)